MYKFEKLEVWQLALDYVDQVYALTEALPDKERYNLTSQARRAATSIALNIAEGSGAIATGGAVQERASATSRQAAEMLVALRKCTSAVPAAPELHPPAGLHRWAG